MCSYSTFDIPEDFMVSYKYKYKIQVHVDILHILHSRRFYGELQGEKGGEKP